jgi:two-component system, chemotaxis family, sensor kinase Cph1
MSEFFDISAFMPHGHCYLWMPWLLWLHVISNMIIALAYFSIPAALIALLYKRQDLEFQWIYAMFAAFILLCGSTHVMDIVTVWLPFYWLDGGLRALTAGVSVVCAVGLWHLMPQAIKLPSVKQLARSNVDLEKMVVERTKELESVNAALTEANRELMRSNEELEHFSYLASHDLQEPLRKLSSFSQLLAEEYGKKLEGEGLEYLEFIVDGAKRMQRLIEDLLEFSRAGAGEQRKKRLSLESTIKEVIQNLELQIAEQSAEILVEPLPTVYADSSDMVRLFQNLIVNALKYSSEETPVIKVSCKKGPTHWTICVEDNGIGIDPKHLDTIFVIFKRLHGKNKYPGTGIGLAICKKIVEKLGGRIWAESTGSGGSTFCFTLPNKEGV